MTVPNLIMWSVATVAAGWKISQVLRVPEDRYLRAVAMCTVFVFIALTAQLATGLPVNMLGPSLPKLVQNVVLTFFFALLIIVLQAAISAPRATRRSRREYLLAVLASVLLTVSCIAAPSASRGVSYEAATVDSAALWFYLVGNAYMAYATARTAYLAWQAARQTQSRARLSLRVAAAGLVICCLGAHLPRVAATSGYLLELPAGLLATERWTTPALAAGIAVFFIGIAYPGARTGMVKAHLWLEARRRYHQLRPLWFIVCRAFPAIALFRPVPLLRELFHLRYMRLRYYRRLIECRDGLVCLSPSLRGGASDTSELARQIGQLADSGASPRPAAARGILAEPLGDSVEADVGELVKLSRELRRLQKVAQGPSLAEA
ncbi:MAB_1171c family putative transporter [Pseudonocardia sp. WMMC193]|uniref:MAB_1171c family putative transporter n=1 Tax=Pseudonocardia sp. WMMC193 TaxID=2911965 RepID=UPI001F3BA87A|nr:MAB_1171c family putative transporter [Pseudonocardia sp. WMMC193]MCF7552572.1 hypothetical protein [Pseudonocardia sp. WMMC193]